MTLTHCIADGCGIEFDTEIPEQRTNLRSFWKRYCPKHRTQGNAGSQVFVNIPAFVDTTWELRTYDVWGNAKDGYEVNDAYRSGEVIIRCKVEVNNAGTPQEFLSAHPSDSQIRKALSLRRFKLETDGDDLHILVNRAKDGYPLGEMYCTSHESLSPIRAKRAEDSNV
jgi:hypothetical protein